MAQLEEAYEHIFTSPRRGLMRLYRLKKRAGAGRARLGPTVAPLAEPDPYLD